MRIYRKVLIASIIVYVLGVAFVSLSAIFVPNTIFKWKATLQVSAPAVVLIGLLYARQKLEWDQYKYLIFGFGAVSLIAVLFRVIPAGVFILTLLALGGVYLSSSPDFKELVSED